MKPVFLRSLVVVAALPAAAWAEIAPQFQLAYANQQATDVVVVDGRGTILETWRGDLVKGEKLPYESDGKNRKVVTFVPGIGPASEVDSVSGDRRVLFLIRPEPGGCWKFAGYLSSAEQLGTVWIEKDQCFAIYQLLIPGDTGMHPLEIDERRLKTKVTRGNDG